MTETRELTCVICPAGCEITVMLEGGVITAIEGYTCKRGKDYAENEVTNPTRTLTSTVVHTGKNGNTMLPVRTDKPIPKDSLTTAMKLIRKVRVTGAIKVGDTVVDDFIEAGVRLIACRNVE